MEGHRLDPRLRGLPELLPVALVLPAVLAAHSLAAGLAGYNQGLHNRPVLLLDFLFVFLGAEGCQL